MWGVGVNFALTSYCWVILYVTVVCVSVSVIYMCVKVEVTPLLTLFAPKGHSLFRRMQTPRLMDDHSDCFPGFSATREIVIHPLGEAKGRLSPLFCSTLIFSRIQDAMERLRAQLPWLSFKGIFYMSFLKNNVWTQTIIKRIAVYYPAETLPSTCILLLFFYVWDIS